MPDTEKQKKAKEELEAKKKAEESAYRERRAPSRYKGEFLSPGTVPKSESDKKAAELARKVSIREGYKNIPEGSNIEGINKFHDILVSKNLVGLPETQTKEGYNRLIKPELEKFNLENPSIAITPDNILKLQEFHSSKNPDKIVYKDSTYGPQTTQFYYKPIVATQESYTSGIKGAKIEPSHEMKGYELIKVPEQSGKGYTGSKDYYINKSTGNIFDPVSMKDTDVNWFNKKKELTAQGQAVSNVITSNTTGDVENADLIKTDPTKVSISNIGAGFDAGLDKNLQRSKEITDVTIPSSNFEDYKKKAKGGLVGQFKKGGKVKGYESGGQTEDNSKEVMAAIGVGLPYVAEGANMAILNKNNVDEYGRIDTGSKTGDYAAGIGSQSISGAAKGAQMGMAAGPYGAIVGAGAGLILGGVKGGMQAKQDRASIEAEKKAEEEAKRMAEVERQRAVYNKSLQGELATRKTGYGYKKGGLVQFCADGGMINDSASGQFNGDLSRSDKKLIKSYGYDPTNLTNEQAIGIRNAEFQANNNYEESTKYGINGGGGLGISAPTAMFKKGGYVKGPGTGTSDSVKAKVEPGSFIVPAKNADKAEKIHEMMDGGKTKKAPKKKVATLNEKDGEEVRLSNGEYKFTPEQRDEIVKELGEDVLEMLAPEAEEYKDGGLTSMKAKEILKDGTVHGKALTDKQKRYMGWIAGGGKPGMYKGGEVDGYAKGGKTKKTPKMSDADKARMEELKKLTPIIGRDAMGNVVPSTIQTDEVIMTPTETEESVTLQGDGGLKLNASESQQLAKKGLTPSQMIDLGTAGLSLLSAQRGMQLPRKQVSIGTEFLAKSGERPVDQINPEFQDVYNKAQQEAKYGFTPEEKALLDQQRLTALNQQRQAARLYGLGYSGERQAINESFGRGLQAAISNKEKQLQKQALANQLAVQKADMSRRLFEDKMSAWQQEQKTGGDLVAQGLKNQIEGRRYQNVLANLMANRAKESSWLNNLNFEG